MKGVSEIIAIILILMIVVAIVALTYTWFSGMFAGMTGTASTAVTNTNSAILTDFSIENARQLTDGNITVDVRNIGIATINTSQIATYIDDAPYTNDAGTSCPNGGVLSDGDTCQFNVTNITTSMCGSKLMISVGVGFEEYETIDC